MTAGGEEQIARVKPFTFTLRLHNRTQIASDVAVSAASKTIRVGMLVELRRDDNDQQKAYTGPSIVLKVSCSRDDIPQDALSIEQTLAGQFGLRAMGNVLVSLTRSSDHTLDLVEMLIKEQYLGQADLWLLANSLGSSSVYVGKLVEMNEMRASVKALWRGGMQVWSGVVSSDPNQTRVVYRSSTTSISIFLLMTREMWEFDLAGDLCYSIVVNSMLADLFSAWQQRSCTHDVTIVLVSRVIYDVESVDELPEDIRESIQRTFKNTFVEDFYDVIVQNERFEDWSSVLLAMNKVFLGFDRRILRKDRREFVTKRRIADCWDGPILESINMVLNSMDNSKADHRFDRTGYSFVAISAGQGVFDVDRGLKSIAKRRCIESGLAIDLVCILPQPFHPVPLFRVFDPNTVPITDSKGVTKQQLVYDYAFSNEWINISFYCVPYGDMALKYTCQELDDRRTVISFPLTADYFHPKSAYRCVARIDLPIDSPAVNSIATSGFPACPRLTGQNVSIVIPQARPALNPFQQPSVPPLLLSSGRASKPHANRWLHAFPLNELKQPMQLHQSTRYRSSSSMSARSNESAGRMALSGAAPSKTAERPLVVATPGNGAVATGIDWQSLVLPAVLPYSAGAGPGLAAWLEERCVQSPHGVIIGSEAIIFGNSKQPRELSSQQVFDLLVLLRLAAGFQIVVSPLLSGDEPAGRKLRDYFKVSTNPPLLMVCGRFYQRLQLSEHEGKVIVTKFMRTARKQSPINALASFKYHFRYRVPDIDSDEFYAKSVDFANRRTDMSLWSSLDYHVTSLSSVRDVDTDEHQLDYTIRTCFWQSSFIVLPAFVGASTKSLPANFKWSDLVFSDARYATSFGRLIGHMNGLTVCRAPAQTPQATPTDSALTLELSELISALETTSACYTDGATKLYTTVDAIAWLVQGGRQASNDSALQYLKQCAGIYRARRQDFFYGICYFTTSKTYSRENLIEVENSTASNQQEKSISLNLDTAGRSQWPELALFVHDSNFRPKCAFKWRLEWLFASGSLLCGLLDSWQHRARLNELQLLPVPSNPFDLAASDPLRRIITLPFRPDRVKEFCQETDIEAPSKHKLTAFQTLCIEALCKHFAFLQIFFQDEKESDYPTYVHCSGVAFIRPTSNSIQWAWNTQISKRWQAVMTMETSDRLLAEVRLVAVNADNRLAEILTGAAAKPR